MGSSSAGVMFIMRSLVRPNTFSATPMMISEPVTLISVMTASVRTPVSRGGQQGDGALQHQNGQGGKRHADAQRTGKGYRPGHVDDRLGHQNGVIVFRPLSSDPITAIAPTANTSEPVTKPSVMEPDLPNFFAASRRRG